jgi:hypothetical protein
MMKPIPITLAMLTLAVVTCGLTSRISRAADSFSDDFTNLDATNPEREPVTWRSVFGGNIAIESGDLIVQRASGLAGALVDGFTAQDISVATQFRILQGTDAGIGIRTTGSTVSDCYFGNLDVANGAGLFRCGPIPFGDSVPVNFDPTQEDAAMRLDVVGDQLRLWVWPADESQPEQPLATAHDSALSEGGVGVYVNPDFGGSTEAVFRFVNVTVLAELEGDFNGNGVVDAADYVVWRNGMGMTYTQSDYDVWRTNFGRTAGNGAVLPSAESLPVGIPEPSSIVLAGLACTGLMILARRRNVRF